MIMLNERFRLLSPKELLLQKLDKVRQEKNLCGEKLKELNRQGRKDEMGDWMHTLTDLEKEEEKLARALEDL